MTEMTEIIPVSSQTNCSYINSSQILFAVFIVNHLELTFVLGRSLLAENSAESRPLRDQTTHLSTNNHERMPQDVVATKLGQEKFLRHLQRFKRSDHPCVKSRRVTTVGTKRFAVVTCYDSINTGCLATMLKYTTPLCVELKMYIHEVGKEITYSCGCKPQTEILTVVNFFTQISMEP